MRILRQVATLAPCVALMCSCAVDKSAEGERIMVTSKDGKAVTKTAYIPLEGESSSWSIKADEDLDIFYKEARGASASWFSITGVTKDGPGSYTVSYTAQPRGNTLELRSGTVNFVAPEHYLGAFVTVRQGYRSVWTQNFGGKEISIVPGTSWTSATLDGISAIKDGWLTFTAKADAIAGNAGLFPLDVTIIGGAEFADIARTRYTVDVQASDNYGAESFFKLHIYNGGKVFSSESKVMLSVPSALSSVIRVSNVSVYEIPVESSGITGISESADE